MGKRSFYLFLFISILSTISAYKSYIGYKVVETEILNESNAEILKTFLSNPLFHFWVRPYVGHKARIMFAPEYLEFGRGALDSLGIETTIFIPDVETVLQKEREELEELRKLAKQNRAPDFSRYYTFEEIMDYITYVEATYPEIASIINIGTSYEGRPMTVLKLSNGPGKPGIFFDSAIHADEWLGPPTAMYAINELTENLANNQAILDKNDFYFLLVTNPDGYVYTHTVDRLWRKTRSPNPGSTCIGTDPNRNFDQAWNAGDVDPCSNVYRGSAPFSEPEIAALRDFVNATTSITFGLSVHTCGQVLIYPFGNTTVLPPNVADLDRVGIAAMEALQAVNGTAYGIGSVANIMYDAFGISTDWYYVKQGLSLAYTIELPCGGPNGSDPPPSEILPVVTETWEAYKVFAANAPVSRIYFE